VYEVFLTRQAQDFYEQADPALVRKLNRCFQHLRENPVFEVDRAATKRQREAKRMDTGIKTQVEKTFLSLPREERETIISHGTALRLSDLRKRLFLAESKVRHFEEKYKVTLAQLDTDGLPDDADYEMHEDYIMWHHWAEVADKIKKSIASLEEIAQQGLYIGELSYAGY
jgi:hypothetical protein